VLNFVLISCYLPFTFHARLPGKAPRGAQFRDVSIQLGSRQCDIEGAEGCGLHAADEHALIDICVRNEKDEEDQASGANKLSSYTTNIAPVLSFY
jgi:hypothetical protein